MLNKQKIDAIFLATVILLSSFFLPVEKIGRKNLAAVTTETATAKNLELEAKAFLVKDLLTGEIMLVKNQLYPLALASITKIISVLVILDNLNLEEQFTIYGEHFTARDLLAMAMAESSNNAIEMLAEKVSKEKGVDFLQLMNQKANALEADGMIFSNPTGLDISDTKSGGYGSAENIMSIAENSLLSALWQFGNISEIVSKEGGKRVLSPTNFIAKEIPNLIGSKTGFTDLAGGNLLVIFEYPLGHPIGIVVLGSSENGRFEDVKKIIEWIKNNKTAISN